MLDIIRDCIQVTGREALNRLLAGEEVYGTEGEEAWKIINGELRVRDCSREEEFEKSNLELNVFLDSKDDDWYVAPPFDVRKELLDHPGEWVGKYFDDEDYAWKYVGFDEDEMIVVSSDHLKPKVTFDCREDGVGIAEYADKIVRLEKKDLDVLAAFKNK